MALIGNVRGRFVSVLQLVGLVTIAAPRAFAGDWPSWRGPEQNGASRDTGLPERWTRDGENVIWKASRGGRSAPIVMNGRVYLLSVAGSGPTVEEGLLCFDAETGHLHWERRSSVFLADAPASRVAWASPAGDPETGFVYVHGSQGTFACLDRDGKLIWQRSLHEEYGRQSDSRGRTSTPLVEGDLVVVGFVNASWGSQAIARHRYAAFDKRTGAVVWWSEPGGRPLDVTGSTPVAATVGGTRLLVDGNADGGIHAVEARTGAKVWDFALSRRGINSSVVVSGDRVFASHGKENLDAISMGRVVCIDATGSGDVTRTHEKWRADGIAAGAPSPALQDARLFVLDDSARLHAIDADTGKVLWRERVGRTMRASPVAADGKLFLGEANGRFLILRPRDTSCAAISEASFVASSGLASEVNGSAAVANGRVYFVTRDELYCLGFKVWSGSRGTPPLAPRDEPPSGDEAPAHVQVTPADLVLYPGQGAVLTARLFDSKGRFLRAARAAWMLKGVKGALTETGRLTIDRGSGFAQGTVEARVDAVTGEARVRVVLPIPFKVGFDDLNDGAAPPGWVGAASSFLVATLEGQKVLRLVADDPKVDSAETFFGLPDWRGYTIEADVMGTESRGNLPDITLVNSGYQLTLQGSSRRLRIVAWAGQPRLDRAVELAWMPGVWYRMKLRCDVQSDKGRVRGKVWPRDQGEPAEWAIEVDDPVPHPGGSPGLQAYPAGVTAKSPGAEAYFDDVQVTRNEL